MTIRFGSTAIGVVSESSLLRASITEQSLGVVDDSASREGLLLGRPGSGEMGEPLWVLYESGDIVLRRTSDEAAAVQAAVYHLRALDNAARSSDPTLRLRTILTPDGEAVLVYPAAIHELSGYDRRLKSRGYTVLPTTIATINLRQRTVQVPSTGADPDKDLMSAPIREIMLGQRDDSPMTDAGAILATIRSVLRRPGDDLEQLLDHALQVGEWSDIIKVESFEKIREDVRALGRSE
jgi:hypothetical protein